MMVDAMAHFSPRGGCCDAICAMLRTARATIVACVYTFTSIRIAAELQTAVARGCSVTVIVDEENVQASWNILKLLARHGVDVFVCHGTGLMHNKFALCDSLNVVTGSFNWTDSAERRNQENSITLVGNLDFGKLFEAAFAAVLLRSQPLKL